VAPHQLTGSQDRAGTRAENRARRRVVICERTRATDDLEFLDKPTPCRPIGSYARVSELIRISRPASPGSTGGAGTGDAWWGRLARSEDVAVA
jgi:hypothetical protein